MQDAGSESDGDESVSSSGSGSGDDFDLTALQTATDAYMDRAVGGE